MQYVITELRAKKISLEGRLEMYKIRLASAESEMRANKQNILDTKSDILEIEEALIQLGATDPS